jgi:hypothetical protein
VVHFEHTALLISTLNVTGFLGDVFRHLKCRDNLERLCLDERLALKWALDKQDMKASIGLNCFRTGSLKWDVVIRRFVVIKFKASLNVKREDISSAHFVYAV